MSPAEGFRPGILPVFRVACSVVTIAAGVAGSVMLVAPWDTGSYFSWPIGPPPLAATVGAFYLASAGLFTVLGLRSDWSAAQGVCVAVLAFTVPTVVATAHHDDLFDWERWQALAWGAVFVATPIIFSALLFIQRNRAREATVPLVALMLWPAAALVGALRSFDDLQPSTRRLAYLFVLAGLATLGGMGLGANRRVAGRPPAEASTSAISSLGGLGDPTWTT